METLNFFVIISNPYTVKLTPSFTAGSIYFNFSCNGSSMKIKQRNHSNIACFTSFFAWVPISFGWLLLCHCTGWHLAFWHRVRWWVSHQVPPILVSGCILPLQLQWSCNLWMFLNSINVYMKNNVHKHKYFCIFVAIQRIDKMTLLQCNTANSYDFMPKLSGTSAINRYTLCKESTGGKYGRNSILPITNSKPTIISSAIAGQS